MLKQLSQLEHKIGDRVYRFSCDANSPLGECHDALAVFKAYVVKALVEAEKEPCEAK